MSAPYGRTGRVRPQGGGWELAIWYLLRLTGLGLFVTALSHFLITHVIFDPADQTANWIMTERWGSIAWRTVDWLMLTFVSFHAFMGMRIIVHDYTRGGVRILLTMSLYLGGIIIWILGTVAVITTPMPV